MIVLVCALLSESPAVAMRFGGTERAAPTGTFDAVGRIVCQSSGARASISDATGWLVGGSDTAVSAAHAFYANGVAIDPRRCVFRLVDADGNVRESARIRYIRSSWSQAGDRGDSAKDVAVIKLDRRLAVEAIPLVAIASVGMGPVRLVSFPADRAERRPRMSSGAMRPFPRGIVKSDDGRRVSDPSRLFASDADSAAGSSGGVYFAPGAGAAIGLHLGYACTGGDCFNIGLRFDRALRDLVAAVADDDGAVDVRLAGAGAIPGRALR